MFGNAGAEPRAPGCPLLCAEENKALHTATEEKPPQAGGQHAPVLLCNTHTCFSISVSKPHTNTLILPDFSVPSQAPGFMLSLLVTLQANCTFLWLSPSSLAWHGAAHAAVRKRWLLRKATSAPLMSAQEQSSDCDVNDVAQH